MRVQAPGFKSEVVDTTGAGDSFLGGMLHRIAQSGKTLEELSEEELYDALLFANATAALTVQRLGAIPALPSLEEVEALVETAKN